MNKKIMFWIDNNLSYFGLAKSITESLGCDSYAIFDVTDRAKKFFKKQDIVDFKKIWFYHDHIKDYTSEPDMDYLKKFEERYGINLFLLAYNERSLYQFNKFYKFSTKEVLLILEQECKLFERIIGEVNPDYLIMYMPFFHYDNLFYRMCKKRDIKCLIIKVTRLNSESCMISEDDETVKINFEKSNMQRTFEELEEIKNGSSLEKRGVKYYLTSSKQELFRAAIDYLFFSKNSNVISHYTYFGRTKIKVLFQTIFDSIKTKQRKKFVDKHFVREIDNDDKIIFFPLHLEEEIALLVIAPFFTNQIEIVKNLVRSMPIDYKLYLKESPVGQLRNWREISIYKELMELPNVKLIHPSVNSSLLMKKSSLVVTISGTAALHAAFYNNPAINFVDTSYSNLSCIEKVSSFDELPKLIRNSLERKVDLSELNDFVEHILKNSFKFNLNELWKLHSDFFQYKGHLADVEIPEGKMKSFLELHKSKFDTLAKEHIKQIV